MENNLELNQLAKEALREDAKWTFFLSIMGFIGVGLMVILAVFIAVKMSSVPSELDPFASIGAAKGLISFIYFAFALFYFFPVYYLYNYSVKMKTALQVNDNNLLAEAFVNLKSHHKFIGITIIVILSLYLIIFLGTIAAIIGSIV
ncbi:MAG: hypothetical protein ACK4M1_10295 [Flavobacterium sp.]